MARLRSPSPIMAPVKEQNTKSFEKVCMLTAAISLTQKILSAELELCSTLHLFNLQISFFYNHASRSQKGKILWWNNAVLFIQFAVNYL